MALIAQRVQSLMRLRLAARIPPILRPFSPDGAQDLGGLWKRDDQLAPGAKLAKPNAMMFFHIPLYVRRGHILAALR